MLADPDFSAMAQAIGIASLGADEKTIWHLTKCYCEITRRIARVWVGGGVLTFDESRQG